ncbi:MAG: hypothetical protein A2306_11355 [Omnitrophica WOR_2 bacterium RIFOXYB2_FULL_38_16]|nr:MAG: hypothetical protein A2447_02955 [Omnitrophica WOR_2 bacterium RIFOXYC2_FULL_38_12]OGX59202.1 MAG: hypothetical protein A2306_11355 [Omnitrophica WOR_2 bacterium RIFOXYB2_FULL_38_16]HBG60443.1 hypothetical protein [Candidatus Omnitrophota bacterium]
MNIKNLQNINSVLKTRKVKDIMSRFAITTTSQTPVTDLAHLLLRFKISGVPVVNNNKEIIGIVTATHLFNIMKQIIGKLENAKEEYKSQKLFVEDIMIKNVFSVGEDDLLLDVINLMCKNNIYTLPVVSGKEIVGIIGRRDVLNVFYGKLNQVLQNG